MDHVQVEAGALAWCLSIARIRKTDRDRKFSRQRSDLRPSGMNLAAQFGQLRVQQDSHMLGVVACHIEERPKVIERTARRHARTAGSARRGTRSRDAECGLAPAAVRPSHASRWHRRPTPRRQRGSRPANASPRQPQPYAHQHARFTDRSAALTSVQPVARCALLPLEQLAANRRAGRRHSQPSWSISNATRSPDSMAPSMPFISTAVWSPAKCSLPCGWRNTSP